MLRRFWFPLDGHLGVGVTAATLEEATTLAEAARRELWPNAQRLGTPVQDVDIRSLDQKHVAPNIGPVTVRGIWYPTNALTKGDLIGLWELESSEAALGLESGSLMMFLPGGELRYASPSADGGLSVSILTFRVEQDSIITNQASAPREERTRYRLIGPNRLELTYDGGLAVFARTS